MRLLRRGDHRRGEVEATPERQLHRYVYYHCTKRKDKNCHEKYLEEKELETQIDFIFSKFQISEQFKDWAIRFVKEPRKDRMSQREESAKPVAEADS